MYFVGYTHTGNLEFFTSTSIPVREDNLPYLAVVGPFKTKRGALWAVKYGKDNPHFATVNDAERLAKIFT